MSQNSLYNSYFHSAKVKQIADSLEAPLAKIQLKGLLGSSLSFVFQAIFKKSEKPFLLILKEKKEKGWVQMGVLLLA